MRTEDRRTLQSKAASEDGATKSYNKRRVREMDRLCSARAEGVKEMFRQQPHRKKSWDPIKDRERAQRIRMLRIPDIGLEEKETRAKYGEEQLGKREIARTNTSHTTNNELRDEREIKGAYADMQVESAYNLNISQAPGQERIMEEATGSCIDD